MARRFQVVQLQRGGRQSRIEAGNGAAIGLVEAVRAAVGRLFGEAHQLDVGHLDQRGGGGQLGTELVQLLEQVGHGLAALRAHRRLQHFGGDERVAVAVAADP